MGMGGGTGTAGTATPHWGRILTLYCIRSKENPYELRDSHNGERFSSKTLSELARLHFESNPPMAEQDTLKTIMDESGRSPVSPAILSAFREAYRDVLHDTEIH